MIRDKKLAKQSDLEEYQKRKEKEAKDLEHALVVAPYVVPGIGPVMWAGKAVDLAVSGASDGKYKSWGNMVDQKTGSGEFIGELTNPGYYAGAFPKLVGKGIQSTSKYALQKAEPYLLGDKSIPMMGGYKPKQEFWNPFKFKPNSEKYYRGIGEKGLEDALDSGVIRQAGFLSGVPKYKAAYYGGGPDGFNRALNYNKNIIVEVGKQSFPRELNINDLQSALGHKATLRHVPTSEVRILKKHRLKGYKEIKIPDNFQSEINWGNWNKEIPSNKSLMELLSNLFSRIVLILRKHFQMVVV